VGDSPAARRERSPALIKFCGLTNVDDLGLACGPDNRMVGPQGWTTRLNDHHDVEWIPPEHLDTGQTRINRYHQPERLHPPPGDAWTPRRADDDEPVVNGPLTFGEAFAADESVVASDDAWTPRRADDDEPVVNEPLTFGEAFGSDDAFASDDAPAPTAPASNGPVLNGPVIKRDNMTRQSGDPDPPDGKAA